MIGDRHLCRRVVAATRVRGYGRHRGNVDDVSAALGPQLGECCLDDPACAVKVDVKHVCDLILMRSSDAFRRVASPLAERAGSIGPPVGTGRPAAWAYGPPSRSTLREGPRHPRRGRRDGEFQVARLESAAEATAASPLICSTRRCCSSRTWSSASSVWRATMFSRR